MSLNSRSWPQAPALRLGTHLGVPDLLKLYCDATANSGRTGSVRAINAVAYGERSGVIGTAPIEPPTLRPPYLEALCAIEDSSHNQPHPLLPPRVPT